MNVQEVLSRCREVGVILAVSPDGKLRATPPGKLPEELRAELRRRKAEILALLQQQESSVSPDYRHLYRQVAETIGDDCWSIDPGWLLNHPEFYQRLKAFDEELTESECTGASEQEYGATLARLMRCVRDARAAYE